MNRNDITVLSSYTIDGVLVEVDSNGNEHFRPIENKSTISKEKESSKSWLGRLVSWWKSALVRPYAKIRDLSDPFGKLDIDDGSNRHGVEIGVEVRF